MENLLMVFEMVWVIAFMANAPVFLVNLTNHKKGWQVSTTDTRRLNLFPKKGVVLGAINPH